MRIAQVAPLVESVPPSLYGGTERIVSYLVEALVEAGHDVTLFASGDSHTLARLRPVCTRSLRLDPACRDPLPYHVLAIEKAMAEADAFDIVHFHHDFLHFPLVRRHPTASLTTLHGRLDLPDIMPLYREYTDLPLISISNHQRRPVPWMNWRRTVYHGIPDAHLPFNSRGGDHVVFLGRMCPEKRPDLAIRIAREAGLGIRLAAKIDVVDRPWFEATVRPLLDEPGVEFVGEITEAQKGEFLGNARALLFPIEWPEPFGLVMIEAMACGTPVVALRAGSVAEVVDDGESGFVVGDADEAVAALGRVSTLDRRRVRDTFERRFSARRMMEDYLSVYDELIGAGNGTMPIAREAPRRGTLASSGTAARRPARANRSQASLEGEDG